MSILRAAARQTNPGNLVYGITDTSGTPGNATINAIRGRCAIAAAGTSVTITNSLVTANSTVLAVITTNDATALLKNVVPGAGSFVITSNAATTGTTKIDFVVFN